MPNQTPSKRALPIIRLFVSSTFSDLKHERNALHTQVWPELERYCQQRGFTFQAIDLRWGVPAEAGLDHRTMRICFEELRRSQETSPEPNFLILLGNRYGWRPLPEVISVAEFGRLKTAAQQIQTEPPDPAKQPTDSQVELLKQAIAVLEDWYLLDENAKPFGEKGEAGEYVLRTRKTLLHGLDNGKYLDADGKRQDTSEWINVQFVLWSIVNRAFPAAGLGDRFTPNKNGDDPSIVRFQASATEQEIWHGALQVDPQHAKEHVIAWFREIENLNDYPPGPQLKDFVDLKEDGTPDQSSKLALEQLTGELKRNLSEENFFESKCRWNVQHQGPSVPDVTTDHLDAMCKQIRERLKVMIILQINAYWGCDLSADDATLAQVRGTQVELDLECADHQRFAGERAPQQTFVGRESELQRIRDYLHSQTNQPFVVHGPSGSGKTALLGKIIQEVTPPRSTDGTRAKTGPIVLTRFIGTTPESSNLRSLLSSLCRELRQDFEMTAPLPTDLNELIDEFYSQLGQASAVRPVFVFLDALDQLDAAHHGRPVFWVRSPLPSTTDGSCHARMVVSCLSPSDEFPEDSDACGPFRDLNVRKLLGNHELGALEEDDARQLFACWLHSAGRSVSETQHEMIWSAMQKSSACRQPLFLKVLFEEARRWQSFDVPSAIPKSLALLLDELFIRLGKPSEHGELTGIALSCLVSARYGLSERELLEILYTDTKYKAIHIEDNKRNGHELPPYSTSIPIAPWTRLRSDLAPYLAERSTPGTAIMHFYHRQVEQAVRRQYLQTPEEQTRRHRQLGDYFERQTFLPRKSVEFPWQLREGNERDRLRHCLLDIVMFLFMYADDQNELMGYWVWLDEERTMGLQYVQAFEQLAGEEGESIALSTVAKELGEFLIQASLFAEAETMTRRALAICELSLGKDHADVATALNNLGVLLTFTNRVTEAEAIYRRALAVDEAIFGPNDLSVASDLHNLSHLLREANRLAESEPLMRRVVTILQQHYGENSPRIISALNSLALLLKTTNRLAEAEPLYRQALSIASHNYPQNHPDIATALNNLGTLLLAMNRLAEAESLLQQAIRAWEQSLGKNHPSVAFGLNNMAQLLQALDRPVEAEPLMRRALAIDQESLGPDHPNVARDLGNLAQLFKVTNRLAEAERLFRRALAIREKSLGDNHPDFATDLCNLALLLRSTTREVEAESLVRRALSIYEQSYGHEHPHIATALSSLAGLLQETGRWAEAETLYRKAMAIYERSLVSDHPNLCVSLDNLAQLLKVTNRLTESEELYRRALAIVERSFGEDHPNVFSAINHLAEILYVTNRLGESEALVRRALAIAERNFRPDDPKVSRSLNDLAALLQSTNRLEESEPLYRRALSIAEGTFGLDHPDVALRLNNLAELLRVTRRFAEAEPLMRRSLAITERSLGPNAPDVAIRLNNLSLLLQNTNRFAEAEPLARRTLQIFLRFSRATGHPHASLQDSVNEYASLLRAMGRSSEQILATLRELAPEFFSR